jgi:hypothetical protein
MHVVEPGRTKPDSGSQSIYSKFLLVEIANIMNENELVISMQEPNVTALETAITRSNALTRRKKN